MFYIVGRAAVVVAILFVVALLNRLYRSWRAGLQDQPAPSARLPEALLVGGERTWVVFTTPWCASCGPVEQRLRASDPAAGLVKVDATREPLLAEAFGVRSTPTVLLADAEGRVQARLVGSSAVERHLAG